MVNHGFSIQYASNFSGVGIHTIRAWERRYGAVTPARGNEGSRVYKVEEIRRLRKLRLLTEVGERISQLAKMSDAQLDELLEVYNINLLEDASDEYSINIEEELARLIFALSEFKLDVISHELERIVEHIDTRSFGLDIVSPLIHEVGERVKAGDLTVAHEHSLSALIYFYMGHLLFRTRSFEIFSDTKVVLAAPEEEYHEFGLMIAALLCQHYGFKFYYFGARMPADALARTCNKINADVLLIGISAGYEKDPVEYLHELDSRISRDIEMWVGGVAQSDIDRKKVHFFEDLAALDQWLSRKRPEGLHQ